MAFYRPVIYNENGKIKENIYVERILAGWGRKDCYWRMPDKESYIEI